jgi:hypothetical protein
MSIAAKRPDFAPEPLRPTAGSPGRIRSQERLTASPMRSSHSARIRNSEGRQIHGICVGKNTDAECSCGRSRVSSRFYRVSSPFVTSAGVAEVPWRIRFHCVMSRVPHCGHCRSRRHAAPCGHASRRSAGTETSNPSPYARSEPLVLVSVPAMRL